MGPRVAAQRTHIPQRARLSPDVGTRPVIGPEPVLQGPVYASNGQ